VKHNANRSLRDLPFVKDFQAIRMLNILRDEFRRDFAEGAKKLGR
jgi:hypothetical protein